VLKELARFDPDWRRILKSIDIFSASRLRIAPKPLLITIDSSSNPPVAEHSLNGPLITLHRLQVIPKPLASHEGDTWRLFET